MHRQGRNGGRLEFCGSSSSRDPHQAAPENNMRNLPFVQGTTTFIGSQSGSLASNNAFGLGWVSHHHSIPIYMPPVSNPHIQTMFYPQGSLVTSFPIIHPYTQPGSSTQFVPLMPVIPHHQLQFRPDYWYAPAQTFTEHPLNLSYQQHPERMRPLIQQIEEYKTGLSEEVISKNIKHGKFEIIGQGTFENNENKELCVICQEDFANGEEVGRLDYCVHQFHICCITHWLAKNNVCPICKRSGLRV